MTKDKALKLALEALEDMNCGWKYIRESHGDLYGVGWDRSQEKADDAIKALRQALDQSPDTTKMIDKDFALNVALEALHNFANDESVDGWKAIDAISVVRKALAQPEQEPVNNQIMFKRLEAYEFAIKEYEDALKAAFPEGATGEAFHHWNAARKHGGRPYLAYEQKERPEMDADMREMQQEIDGLLKANMELQADADAWRNFKSKTLLMRTKK